MNSKVDFAAGGIVIEKNKILIVKNKKGDSSNDSESWWGYPKGHLEEGEKPSEAAVREVIEETGFIVELLDEKPIAESRYEIEVNGQKISKTVWFYEMKVVEPFKNEPDDEIQEIAIVEFEKAIELLTHEEDKKILKYVFNR
ncbi:MAG: NUDIX domain-containing protein [Actinomycetota bacterium]|nr:NUDIX domain-containing protein [Actinomycetota bacterium]MDA3013431.1 NUDIX domain-containing protein [Actinomycetota bacterium]